jgi:hypothetical protein
VSLAGNFDLAKKAVRVEKIAPLRSSAVQSDSLTSSSLGSKPRHGPKSAGKLNLLQTCPEIAEGV